MKTFCIAVALAALAGADAFVAQSTAARSLTSMSAGGNPKVQLQNRKVHVCAGTAALLLQLAQKQYVNKTQLGNY
jgi:hypothetical protein